VRLKLPFAAALLLLGVACLRLVDFHAQCATESDCTDGQICFESQCRGPCVYDNECGDPKLRCRDKRCQTFCTADAPCGTGKICDDGSCVAGCRQTSDCPGDLACVELQCQAVQRCKQNSECAYPQLCFEEACVYRKCNAAAACPSDLQCLGGRCVVPGSSGIPDTGCGKTGLHCCARYACEQGCCARVDATNFACVANAKPCGASGSFCEAASGSCGGCGGPGQPCCSSGGDAGWCSAGNVMCDRQTMTCKPCGGEGQRCCGISSSLGAGPDSGFACDSGLSCSIATGAELCTKGS
jgi:hypothetical protein